MNFFSSGVNTIFTAAFVETGVKALYDDENLYWGFICADQDPSALKAEIMSEMNFFSVKDDSLYLFIQPDETKWEYYQLAFNPRGTRFDQKVSGKGSSGRDYAYRPDWKVITHKDKEFWTAEVIIPFASFELPNKGKTKWRINFHRMVRDDLIAPSSWAKAEKWHSPPDFGRLFFEQDK